MHLHPLFFLVLGQERLTLFAVFLRFLLAFLLFFGVQLFRVAHHDFARLLLGQLRFLAGHHVFNRPSQHLHVHLVTDALEIIADLHADAVTDLLLLVL